MNIKTALANLVRYFRLRNKDTLINLFLFSAGFICLSQGINEQTRTLAYFSSFFFYFLIRRFNPLQNLILGFLTGALYGYAFLGWFYVFKFTVVLVAGAVHGLFFSTIFACASLLFRKFPKSIFVHIFSLGFMLFFIRLLFYYSPFAAYVESFLTIVNTSSVFDHLIPYFGTSVVDVIVLAIGCILAQIFIQIKTKKLSKYLYFYIIFFITLFFIRFTNPILPHVDSPKNSSVKIALIQPNIDWSWEERLATAEPVIDYFVSETEIAAKKGAKIVVWPEHAILADMFHTKPDIVKRLISVSRKNNVVIVAGALEFMGSEPNPDKKWIGYDTSVVFDPQTQNMRYYRAVHPISGNVKAGDKSVIFNTSYGSFPVVSCFEVAYHKFVADYSNQNKPVDFFIGIANIQVFLGTDGGRRIQDHIYRVALENGKYFIYVSNTGPSLIVDPSGNITDRIPEGERKTLLVDIPKIQRQTFYSKYQMIPVLLVFVACYSAVYIRTKRKKNN